MGGYYPPICFAFPRGKADFSPQGNQFTVGRGLAPAANRQPGGLAFPEGKVARRRRDGRGITKNPEGNLPLMSEVSPQVTEGEKFYPIRFSR